MNLILYNTIFLYKFNNMLCKTGWQGFGGSLINWHQELEIGFGYAMNLCDPDGSNLKGLKIRKVAYECAYKLK